MMFWLEGIVEDTPLPDEVSSILFTIKKNGGYNFLELKGYEKEPNDNVPCFYPLEAQFFNCLSLAKQTEDFFYKKIKFIIDEAFANLVLKESFKGRKIYLKYKNKNEFLFKIN